ncbi:MAG: hypothetical protein H7338_03830 [Candidatus Sericytochromatia bacterium]|nr:hypothetical protein [Candidatus Sericytochromatia bacterium]
MGLRFYWDFYGGSAEGTATHFHKHLDEFLTRNGITGCRTGMLQAGKVQFAAWCEAPADHQAAIAKALRPRREEAVAEPGPTEAQTPDQ